jgi:hypothetical protein
MSYQVIKDFIWYDDVYLTGQTITPDEVLSNRWLRAGYIKPVKIIKDDKNVDKDGNGGDIPADDSAGEDTPKRRVVRRHK